MKYRSCILVACLLLSSCGTLFAKGKKTSSWLDATVEAKTKGTKAGTFHHRRKRNGETRIGNYRRTGWQQP